MMCCFVFLLNQVTCASEEFAWIGPSPGSRGAITTFLARDPFLHKDIRILSFSWLSGGSHLGRREAVKQFDEQHQVTSPRRIPYVFSRCLTSYGNTTGCVETNCRVTIQLFSEVKFSTLPSAPWQLLLFSVDICELRTFSLSEAA